MIGLKYWFHFFFCQKSELLSCWLGPCRSARCGEGLGMSTVDCTNELEVGGGYVGSFTVPVEGTTGQ